MRTTLVIALFGSSIVIALASACSSTTTPPPDYAGSCDLLATRCHASTTPLMKECHDLGHDGDDGKCGPRRAECLTACPEEAAPADAAVDVVTDASTAADASDAETDPACTSLCTCLETTCADQSSYPFTDPGSCEAACAAFSAGSHVFPVLLREGGRWREQSARLRPCNGEAGKPGVPLSAAK